MVAGGAVPVSTHINCDAVNTFWKKGEQEQQRQGIIKYVILDTYPLSVLYIYPRAGL